MTTDANTACDVFAPSTSRHFIWLSVLALPLLTLLMFADVLFTSEKILSSANEDIVQQCLPWRVFGFGQLRAGHLAQWNPHIFLGMPFLGIMQSAMFYPPNYLHLILPDGLATNWLIVLHVLASGLFMQFWAARRGLHPVACIVAGALLMFCSPEFLRIRAGFLAMLLAMPWIVLVFVAIDELLRAPRLAWYLTGSGALALLILAHPQLFFFTLVAAGIYAFLCLIDLPRPWFIAAVLAAMLPAAAALTAVQLLSGQDVAAESVRSAGMPYELAATFSFPPEGFLTLLAPGLFGDHAHVPYWGRWNMWETSLFFGVTGLVLAVYGAIYGKPSVRRHSVTMVVILMLLALGGYTPLFRLLYLYVPGFDKFRAVSRFDYPAALFLCLLAAIGLDRLIVQPRRLGYTAAAITGVAVLLSIAAAALYLAVAGQPPAAWWKNLLAGIESSGQIGRAPQVYTVDALRRCGVSAAVSLLIAAGALVTAAALLMILRTKRAAAYGIAVLAVAEIFAFAWLSRDTFNLSQAYSADLAQFLRVHPGDYRIFNTMNTNAGMVNGADDIWGYESLMPLRLAELIASTQGQQESAVYAASYPVYPLRGYHPFYKALRFRYLVRRAGETVQVQEFPDVLPRLLLVSDYRVIRNRSEALAAVSDPAFDAARTVILEDDPGIARNPSAAPGTVSLLESSTDHLVIKAETTAPTILLVTDGWSKNWVAKATDGSREYKVIPADYVLRAIPLEAGEHSIRLEYRPISYQIGKWVSLVSLACYGIAVVIAIVRIRTIKRDASPSIATADT